MFDFRIIDTPDGNQIIDPSLKTSYDSLTPSKMIDYIEMDKQMTYMDCLQKKRKKEKCKRKNIKNSLWKIGYFCRLVQ